MHKPAEENLRSLKTSKNKIASILMIKNDKGWREQRLNQDCRENLEKMLEPPPPHERALWNLADLRDINIEASNKKILLGMILEVGKILWSV